MATKHKRKAALSLPSYTLKDKKQDEPFFVRIDGDMTTRDQTKTDGTPDKDDKGKVKTITTCLVTDIDTGEVGEMVLPYVLKKSLDTFVTGGGKLVGSSFEIIRGKKVNKTFEWTVYTVE